VGTRIVQEIPNMYTMLKDGTSLQFCAWRFCKL